MAEVMVEVSEADALTLKKQRTRQSTLRAIKAGKLVKLPCVVCGTREDIQAHHIDYDDPDMISWVCRDHHMAFHSAVRYSHTPGYRELLDPYVRVLEYLRKRLVASSIEEVAIACAIPTLEFTRTILCRLVTEGFASFPDNIEHKTYS